MKNSSEYVSGTQILASYRTYGKEGNREFLIYIHITIVCSSS